MIKPLIEQKANKLLVLVNLGSPAELSLAAIREFLREFLSDKRVVGLSRWVWLPLLYLIILPLRVKKLLHKYQLIWLDNGKSPLVYYTEKQAMNLQQNLASKGYKVDYAFCYGQRNLKYVLDNVQPHFSELILIPLYPQFSSSTTAAVFDQVAAYYRQNYYIPRLKFINGFATNRQYICAVAGLARNYWQAHGRPEQLVVSFHALPIDLIAKGDTYLSECQQTFAALCQELNLDPEREAKLCFQSKFGRAKWLEPATSATLQNLAQAGTKSVALICPGFVCDCLETLEEVAIQYRNEFINYGGKQFQYIPCLNASPELSQVLVNIIERS